MKQQNCRILIVKVLLFFLFVSAIVSQTALAASATTVTVGGTPYAIAITPDGKYAYVPNSQGVSLIDTVTNKLTATVAAQNWPSGIAITPDGKYVYVVDANSPQGQEGIVSVINTATNTVTASITVGGNPERGLAISPNGKNVYVPNNDGTVAVISTATNTITAKITIPSLNVTDTTDKFNGQDPPHVITIAGICHPQAVAISPNGEHAYVATADGRVAVVNTTSNTIMSIITIGGSPTSLALTPNGQSLYVANSSVVVIDTVSNAVLKVIDGMGPATCASVSPDGQHVYVTNYFNNTISIISTATNLVEKTLPVGMNPYGLAVTPNGQYVYVTNLAYTATTDSPSVNWNGLVTVIDTAVSAGDSSNTSSENPIASTFSTQTAVIIVFLLVIAILVVIVIKQKTDKTKRRKERSNQAP